MSKLSEFNFIVAIDTSGSMGEPVKAGSKISRWEAVQESAMTLIRDVEQYDDDGLGLVLFGGSKINSFDGVTADKFREIFSTRSPRGSTPMAQALKEAVNLVNAGRKPVVVVVFTDGVPDSKADVIDVITQTSNSIESDEDLTFLFIQVGDDAAAKLYLETLDNDLKNCKFDIVDVKTVDQVDAFDSTTELILHALAD
jgi:Mg-chelatase subunit ChlD